MERFQALLRERTVGRGDLTKLAAAAGLATSVVSRWRDGIARPLPENLEQIAPVLGVAYVDLMAMCGYLPQKERPANSKPGGLEIVGPVTDDDREMVELVLEVDEEYRDSIKRQLRALAVPPTSPKGGKPPRRLFVRHIAPCDRAIDSAAPKTLDITSFGRSAGRAHVRRDKWAA